MENWVRCPSGHDNPADRKYCGECGAPLGEDLASMGAPLDEVQAETTSETPPTVPPAPPEESWSAAGPSRSTGVSKSIWVLGGAIVLAAAIVGGVLLFTRSSGNPSEEPRPSHLYKLRGTLEASECGGGYEIEYASVEVRDQNDRIIGSGTTGGDTGSGLGGSCVVEFEVNVPKANFYQVKIGSHGGPSYSFEELQAQDFQLDLSLSD